VEKKVEGNNSQQQQAQQTNNNPSPNSGDAHQQAVAPVSPSDVATAESRGTASLGMGITSLVLSMVAPIFLGIITIIVAVNRGDYNILRIICILLGIAGITLGALAIAFGNASRRVPDNKNRKFYVALAGLITGSIGLALSIFYTVIYGIVFLVSI